jgi:hypothetical protein
MDMDLDDHDEDKGLGREFRNPPWTSTRAKLGLVLPCNFYIPFPTLTVDT